VEHTSLSTFHVSAVPRTAVSNQRRRKLRKSEILSGSKYENTLEEKLRENAAEDGEKTAQCEQTVVRRNVVFA
jgi:hypothetical protein